MKSLKFSKYSGAGNTFVIVDLKSWLEQENPKSLITKICSSSIGVAADGLLVLHPKSADTYKWEFYNSDASTAEMCGNLARCATLWAQPKENQKITFETEAGLVLGAKVTGAEDAFEVDMTEAKSQDIFIEDNPVYDTGVPHLIRFVQELPELDQARSELRTEAQRLRKHSALGAAGANVTYLQEIAPTEIRAVTFERGVEDFTQACGTGAVAAAFHQSLRSGKKQITVHMPGGTLHVDFTSSKPKLRGPAFEVARGEWIVR